MSCGINRSRRSAPSEEPPQTDVLTYKVLRPHDDRTMDLETYRDALLRKRGELVGGTAAKPLQWTMENNSGRQGDMADQASGNNEVHIQLKLKQTDAKILQAIEDALHRIDA